jgi:hypothetical protein
LSSIRNFEIPERAALPNPEQALSSAFADALKACTFDKGITIECLKRRHTVKDLDSEVHYDKYPDTRGVQASRNQNVSTEIVC